MAKVQMGRPKKSENEKRSFKQNFRLNKEQNNKLTKVPRKSKTEKWCFLLDFWAERKLKD